MCKTTSVASASGAVQLQQRTSDINCYSPCNAHS